MRIAIVTGASSGLGSEFVKQISERYEDNAEAEGLGLDEIWVIARRAERLEKLKESVGTPVRAIAADLTRQEDIARIAGLLELEKPRVHILVNSAGMGYFGTYETVGVKEANNMIDLNCRAAVDMTQICLPYMKKGDRIIEICSTAAFQPFQGLNVYAASKSFLYRYSRALRVELLPRGIKVTAVCPYWIKDTEFISVGRTTDKNKKAIHGFPFATNKRFVVLSALNASAVGAAVCTPGIVSTLHRVVTKVVPNEIMMGLWSVIRRL
jgi:short-subunit dehydrogenase